MQQLRHDEVRDLIVDGSPEEDDSLVQEAAVDVERALPAGGLLDDHRYQWAHSPRFSFASPAGFLQAGCGRARIHRLAVRRPQPAGLLQGVWLGAARALCARALGAFLL